MKDPIRTGTIVVSRRGDEQAVQKQGRERRGREIRNFGDNSTYNKDSTVDEADMNS
jgi:hypothetical protein